MRRTIVPLVALLLAGIGAALPTAQTFACSCAMSTPEDALGFADAAFVGTVVATRDIQVAVAGFDPTPAVAYTFEVEGSAKAVTEASIDVVSAGDSAMCGTAFAIQQRYLVFATIVDGRLDTGLCSGNLELAAGDDAPVAVTPITAAPDPQPSGPPPPLLALGAAVVGVAAASLFAFGRSRRPQVS